RHMSSHSEQFEFICPECGYVCDKNFKLKKHMLKHSTEKPYHCEICPFKGGTKYSLEKHNLSHTPAELPFACTLCDYRCYIKGILEKHMLRHSGEKPFGCTMCDYKCTGNGNLKRHMMTHTGEKPFACSECPHKCGDKDSLKNHMMTHSGETAFSCTECDYQCRVKSALHRHMLKHTGEKPFECTQCDYKCVQITQLKMHMLNHTGMKPFACSQCDYRCTSKGSLKSHMVSHTGERRFSCVLCGLKFSANSTLKTHLLKHSGEKPYACTLCEYRCTSRSNLKKHVMIHTGDKPYICDTCDYRCSDKSSLNSHKRSKHFKNTPAGNINTQKSLWPCVDCGQIFEKKCRLIEHMSSQNCKNKNGNSGIKEENVEREAGKNKLVGEHSTSNEIQNGIEHNAGVTSSNTPKSLWPCVDCGEIFEKKSRLIEHMGSKHGKNKYGIIETREKNVEREPVTNISEEESLSSNDIEIPNEIEHNAVAPPSNTPKSLWPCVDCEEIFEKKSRLIEHMASIHSKNKYGNIEIREDYAEREHEINISEEESLTSNEMKFQNGIDINTNVTPVNTPKSLWPCVDCEEIFEKKSRLLEHMACLHGMNENGNISTREDFIERKQKPNISEEESLSSNDIDIQNGMDDNVATIQNDFAVIEPDIHVTQMLS
ncbi:unnamed protein product, partial [Meganyctiphanes norvegica]